MNIIIELSIDSKQYIYVKQDDPIPTNSHHGHSENE